MNLTKRFSFFSLLLMLFAQSFAPLTMACQMHQHGMAVEQSAAHAMPSHAGHDMSMMSVDDNSDNEDNAMTDCCDDDCSCPKGSCAQASLIGSTTVVGVFKVSQSALECSSGFIPSPFQSFFKPPITA